MAVEVSDSIPRGPDSDLPIVTRRQAKNSVTVQNGGTVAVAGLTENRTRQVEKRVPVLGQHSHHRTGVPNNDDRKSTKEIAVFVTATLVPENGPMTANPARGPQAIGISGQPQPAGQEFKDGLAEALKNQSQ